MTELSDMIREKAVKLDRYEVMNVRTGECFGNHTYNEAVSRKHAMTINWNYKHKFVVVKKAD